MGQYFDEEQMSQNFAGDDEIIRDIIQEFLAQQQNYWRNLTAAIEQKDMKQIEVSSHTLKGLFATFGSVQARDFALEIETQARNGQLEGVADLSQKIAPLLENLCAELKAYLGDSAKAA